MTDNGGTLVDAFPITSSVFGLNANWFEALSPVLVRPALALMVLLLVIAVGIMALNRFENADLEKKLWNIPVIILLTMFWPSLVLGIKRLVDTFNTFLVYYVFQMPWHGFGFPELGSWTNIIGWSAEGVARLLPNFSYWLIYAFYILFFFFYAVLGPLVLAKGILFDEIEAFLEVIREITILFLWQTTLVILVGFAMPEIVSGKRFPDATEPSFYFMSLVIGVLILFVPGITRKFGNHLGSSIFPSGLRFVLPMIGFSVVGGVGGMAARTVGKSEEFTHRFHIWKHRILGFSELREKRRLQAELLDLEEDNRRLEREIGRQHAHMGEEDPFDREGSLKETHAYSFFGRTANVPATPLTREAAEKNPLLDLAKKAKSEWESK